MGRFVRKAVFFLWAIFFLRLVVQVAQAEGPQNVDPQNGLYTASQAAPVANRIVSQ